MVQLLPTLLPSQIQTVKIISSSKASSTILMAIQKKRVKIPIVMVLENHTKSTTVSVVLSTSILTTTTLLAYFIWCTTLGSLCCPPNSSSPNWLIDSNASYNVTDDLNNLSLHSEYDGLMTLLLGMGLVLRLPVWVLQNYPLCRNPFYFPMSFVLLILKKINFDFTVV